MEPSKISSETTVFFPFPCLLLLLSFSVSYRSIPFRVWIRKHGLLLFQNSNPRSQNLISNFKSLFLSFSLSLSQRFRDLDLPSRSHVVQAFALFAIWIFPHGSCCSDSDSDLDLPFRNSCIFVVDLPFQNSCIFVVDLPFQNSCCFVFG
ncbi:hypothetical protein HanRHA438_Chr00c06g0845951 [Helianthus annuus]|nr:hypothetical protein HanRHA438_Chr00c06g0845951 [Helianthus annuus]